LDGSPLISSSASIFFPSSCTLSVLFPIIQGFFRPRPIHFRFFIFFLILLPYPISFCLTLFTCSVYFSVHVLPFLFLYHLFQTLNQLE
jgi:hypothetical protein